MPEQQNLSFIYFKIVISIKKILRIYNIEYSQLKLIYDIFVKCIWVATRWAAVQYTFTHKEIQRTTQNKKYIEQHKYFGRVRTVPRFCGLCSGICLTTDEKARKNISQGSRRVPASAMKVHKHTIRIHRHNYKNT